MTSHASSQVEFARRLKVLMKLPGNKTCAECSVARPTWASIITPPPGTPDGSKSFGIFCCFECSALHRHLGVHLAFVRSINLDEWKEHEVLAMEYGGNHKINEIYEAKHDLVEAHKPNEGTDRRIREIFIRNKYEHRLYYDHDALVAFCLSKQCSNLSDSVVSMMSLGHDSSTTVFSYIEEDPPSILSTNNSWGRCTNAIMSNVQQQQQEAMKQQHEDVLSTTTTSSCTRSRSIPTRQKKHEKTTTTTTTTTTKAARTAVSDPYNDSILFKKLCQINISGGSQAINEYEVTNCRGKTRVFRSPAIRHTQGTRNRSNMLSLQGTTPSSTTKPVETKPTCINLVKNSRCIVQQQSPRSSMSSNTIPTTTTTITTTTTTGNEYPRTMDLDQDLTRMEAPQPIQMQQPYYHRHNHRKSIHSDNGISSCELMGIANNHHPGKRLLGCILNSKKKTKPKLDKFVVPSNSMVSSSSPRKKITGIDTLLKQLDEARKIKEKRNRGDPKQATLPGEGGLLLPEETGGFSNAP